MTQNKFPGDDFVKLQAEVAAMAFETVAMDPCEVCGDVPTLVIGAGGRTTVHHCEHVDMITD